MRNRLSQFYHAFELVGCRLAQDWQRIERGSLPTTCCWCWQELDCCGWDGQGSMAVLHCQPTWLPPWLSWTPTSALPLACWCGHAWMCWYSANHPSSVQCKGWLQDWLSLHLPQVSWSHYFTQLEHCRMILFSSQLDSKLVCSKLTRRLIPWREQKLSSRDPRSFFCGIHAEWTMFRSKLTRGLTFF